MTLPELQQALEENPDDWGLRHQLVEALVAEGRHDAAVEVVNNGQALPREAGPWLDAGRCYAAVGALEQAQGLVDSALEIDPEHQPSLEFRAQLEDWIAQTAEQASQTDTPEGEEAPAPDGETAGSEQPAADVAAAFQAAAAGEAIALPKVSFSTDEIDALHAAEEEARLRREAAIRRDKFNSIAITVVIHVVIILLLTLVATSVPPRVPPQIVASSSVEQPTETIEEEKMQKPTVDPTTAVNSAVADIISVSAESSFSVSNIDVPVADVAVENVTSFNPSMSLGMPTSAESKMMFGQPMEGDVLGVVLDVSGSMAEYLPLVVREIDKNFKDAPVVYVRNMLMRREGSDQNVQLVIPEEVVPRNPEDKKPTEYSFLWWDLPRKAPQRYVDRLIETFRTRPNQFLVTGRRGSAVDSAVNFLIEQDVDSIYMFSDFEDFVDDDFALETGQGLAREKIRTYFQPAEKGTEFLETMTKRIANRTLGRRMPSLASILGSTGETEEEDSLLLPPRGSESEMPEVDFEVTYAKPRELRVADEFYSFRPKENWDVIHVIEEPEYDAVFYGPQARVAIFLKTDEGYIQEPITFDWHAGKRVPDHPNPRMRYQNREFIRLVEPPSFNGDEIVWKMIVEGELQFDVHLYLGRKGMNVTYTVENPEDGTGLNASVSFDIPPLARERDDNYYGHDFPAGGVKLDDVRAVVEPNEVIFNLPSQAEDVHGNSWKVQGFEKGYNTRKFNELIRSYPNGVRDLVIQGPSWGDRKVRLRTTSNKIFLNSNARSDSEPWESFGASLSRSSDEREGFTKTEAIEIEIE